MNKITSVAFDLDGTVYCGSSAVAGAVETASALVESGFHVFYFTNNSGKTREQIVEKLIGLGLPAEPQDTYCSAYALTVYLLEKNLKTVYFIGTNDVRDSLSASGIGVLDSPQVSAVVVALDPSFAYSKIAVALESVRNGAKLIIANTDPSYPIENGKRMPGCGAMAGAIIGATSHPPDFVVGKPNTYMLELLCRDHKISSSKICIIGDSPTSDIAMAKRLHSQHILFDPHNEFPTHVGTRVQKIQDIISALKRIS